jgi:hypothetical protein
MAERENLPSKLKGYKNTFVVHSNSGASAATAAMASMLGRSQEFGSYFRFSGQLIPAIEPNDSAVAVVSGPNNLRVDFKADWASFLRNTGLPTCDLKFDESRTLNENTMRYLNTYNRRIPRAVPRAAHESRELSVPHAYQQDYLTLKEAMRSGNDLRPYMSRDFIKKKRPDKNDGLLNSWGIQHFHFRPEGTDHLLFCKVTDSDIFVIQVLPHDTDSWVDDRLIEILHTNWPEEIKAGKLHCISPEAFPPDKRSALRNQNTNFPITTSDNTVYLAPGGGLMASGDNSEDRLNCTKIFAELDYWQKLVTDNVAEVRTALNWDDPSIMLSIRMIFDNREYCIYEATTGTRITFNLPTNS